MFSDNRDSNWQEWDRILDKAGLDLGLISMACLAVGNSSLRVITLVILGAIVGYIYDRDRRKLSERLNQLAKIGADMSQEEFTEWYSLSRGRHSRRNHRGFNLGYWLFITVLIYSAVRSFDRAFFNVLEIISNIFS